MLASLAGLRRGLRCGLRRDRPRHAICQSGLDAKVSRANACASERDMQRRKRDSGSTETQLAHLCHATGSGATAVMEQALAHYYRDVFGPAALLSFRIPGTALQQDAQETCPQEG